MNDTTAVVIAHWYMDESQTYKVTTTANTVEDDKTISSETILYDLSVKIIDSTQVGYILECRRNNYRINTTEKYDSVFTRIDEDIPFWVTTDEFGSSVQVLNWEDVGNALKERGQQILDNYKGNAEMTKRVNKMIRQSSTKQMVENNLILDMQQMLAFHGAKYKYGERIDFQVKVPNNYGGDPFDANTSMIMDQINLSQESIIIRSSQRINPQQLTAVTYDYLSSLDIVGAELPTREEFPMITKLSWGGNEIHSNSGWVIYSVETKQTNSGEVVTVEERTIELVAGTETK
ncbi:MAG: hypothetical protein P1U56_06630 [Saprospiraceae bacterium]|nr:hypothetical protein [Saprospiraceae bacterium]